MNNLKKLALHFIAVSLLVFFTLNGQAQATTMTAYKIQLGAYKANKNIPNYDHLANIGTIHIEDANGLKRVVMGYYDSRQNADKALSQIKATGKNIDAFVVTYQKSADAQSSSKPSTYAPTSDNTRTGRQTMLIEIGTYKQVADVPSLDIIQKLGKVYEIRKGNISTVLLGDFNSKDATTVVINQLKNLGFSHPTVVMTETQNLSQVADLGSNAQKARNGRTSQKSRSGDTQGSSGGATSVKATPYAEKEKKAVTAGPAGALPAGVVPPTIVTQSLLGIRPTAHAFQEFSSLFKPSDFTITHIESYDPTHEGAQNRNTDPNLVSKNRILKGSLIPAHLTTVFEKTPNAGLQYHAVITFPISPTHQGFVIRYGRGQYQQDNYVYLYVYDKTNQTMSEKQLLSSVIGSTGFYTKYQSWITDLDENGSLDMLTYETQEYSDVNGDIVSKDKVIGKVWLQNSYVEADLDDEALFKEKLGVGN